MQHVYFISICIVVDVLLPSSGWAKKSDTSRALHYIVREVSLFWPTLYMKRGQYFVHTVHRRYRCILCEFSKQECYRRNLLRADDVQVYCRRFMLISKFERIVVLLRRNKNKYVNI